MAAAGNEPQGATVVKYCGSLSDPWAKRASGSLAAGGRKRCAIQRKYLFSGLSKGKGRE